MSAQYEVVAQVRSLLSTDLWLRELAINPYRVLEAVLLIAGVLVLIIGMNASESITDQASKLLTGHFTQATVWHLVGGIAVAVVGLTLVIFGGPTREGKRRLASRAKKRSFPMSKRTIDSDKAKRIGDTLGIDWNKVDLEQFREGLEVEFEHGKHDPETNVINDDAVLTGKIAWAHLKEFPDYYTRLKQLEAEADVYWASRR